MKAFLPSLKVQDDLSKNQNCENDWYHKKDKTHNKENSWKVNKWENIISDWMWRKHKRAQENLDSRFPLIISLICSGVLFLVCCSIDSAVLIYLVSKCVATLVVLNVFLDFIDFLIPPLPKIQRYPTKMHHSWSHMYSPKETTEGKIW